MLCNKIIYVYASKTAFFKLNKIKSKNPEKKVPNIKIKFETSDLKIIVIIESYNDYLSNNL